MISESNGGYKGVREGRREKEERERGRQEMREVEVREGEREEGRDGGSMNKRKRRGHF